MFDPTKAVSPSQAARQLGLSRSMVALLCRNGQLKAVRTPLGWLVDPEDVRRLARLRAEHPRQRGRQ